MVLAEGCFRDSETTAQSPGGKGQQKVTVEPMEVVVLHCSVTDTNEASRTTNTSTGSGDRPCRNDDLNFSGLDILQQPLQGRRSIVPPDRRAPGMDFGREAAARAAERFIRWCARPIVESMPYSSSAGGPSEASEPLPKKHLAETMNLGKSCEDSKPVRR
jgi:hypothetical protein